ncbi:MAG: thioredoxin family protein, partial [Planctomycetota bacterium]
MGDEHRSPEVLRTQSTGVLTALLLCTALLTAVDVPLAIPLVAKPSTWTTNIRAALTETPARPLVILVMTPSCHWCHVLKQDAEDNASLRQSVRQTTAIEVDASVHPDLAARWGVQAFPTLLLVNRKRELVKRIVGYQAPDDLAVSINVLVLHGDDPAQRSETLSFAPAPPSAVLLAGDNATAAVAAALDAAEANDTVIIKEGEYTENIVIRKPVTLISELGGAKTTVKAAVDGEPVIMIDGAKDVTLSGFTVTGSLVSGILLSKASGAVVTNNRA